MGERQWHLEQNLVVQVLEITRNLGKYHLHRKHSRAKEAVGRKLDLGPIWSTVMVNVGMVLMQN